MNTTQRYGLYLTHEHSHISRAETAIDIVFGLVRPHQHGIALTAEADVKATARTLTLC